MRERSLSSRLPSWRRLLIALYLFVQTGCGGEIATGPAPDPEARQKELKELNQKRQKEFDPKKSTPPNQ